jgi:hypothetical protein
MKHILPAMAALALLAGCTASLNGSVTPGSSTSTGGTGSTGSTATGTVGAAAGAALTSVYAVGKKFEYQVSGPATGTISWEVTDVKDNKATVKTTSTIGGSTSSSTTTIDLTAKNPYSGVGAGGDITTTIELKSHS